jgi:hypothetical protein
VLEKIINKKQYNIKVDVASSANTIKISHP